MTRQGETRAKIIEILNANPRATNAEIANAIGRSPGRVSQVRVELNRPQGRLKRGTYGKQGTATVTPEYSWLDTIKAKVKKIARR